MLKVEDRHFLHAAVNMIAQACGLVLIPSSPNQLLAKLLINKELIEILYVERNHEIIIKLLRISLPFD